MTNGSSPPLKLVIWTSLLKSTKALNDFYPIRAFLPFRNIRLQELYILKSPPAYWTSTTEFVVDTISDALLPENMPTPCLTRRLYSLWVPLPKLFHAKWALLLIMLEIFSTQFLQQKLAPPIMIPNFHRLFIPNEQIFFYAPHLKQRHSFSFSGHTAFLGMTLTIHEMAIHPEQIVQ